MYSFFDLGGTKQARALAGFGAVIITIAMMATAIIPASPAAPAMMGVLA